MLKTTRWSPDTCQCVLEYSWDSSLPSDQIVHTVTNVVKACSFHENENNLITHFSKVSEENIRKNKIVEEIIKSLPELVTIDEKGNKSINESIFSYEFDQDRNLKINILGLKSAEKISLQAKADSVFGTSKVNIN